MSNKTPYKVKVTIGDATVEVEGEERGVVAIVKALSEVLTSGTPAGSPVVSSATQRAEIAARLQAPQIKDVRSFFQEKMPHTNREAAAVATFYYQYLAPEGVKRETMDSDLLGRAFRQANWPLPKVISQTLIDSKAAGYLDHAGDPGIYRLNPVGYNLVEHTLGRRKIEPPKQPTAKRRRKIISQKKRKRGTK